MQQQEDAGTFQKYQHYKNPPHGPQGQGQQITKEWKLSRRMYRSILENF